MSLVSLHSWITFFSPVLFTQPDQRPSASANDFWSRSVVVMMSCWMTACHMQPRTRRSCGAHLRRRPLLSSEPSDVKPRMDTKLLCVLLKAVEELGLEWSPLEEPSRSHLNK